MANPEPNPPPMTVPIKVTIKKTKTALYDIEVSTEILQVVRVNDKTVQGDTSRERCSNFACYHVSRC
jgi:hypothetical protein